MKKKHHNHHHHKLKPLIEFCNHYTPKADSEFENKCLKDFTSEKFVKAKCPERNACALPCTFCEPLSQVLSEMEKTVNFSGVLEEATVDQAPLDKFCLSRRVDCQRQTSGKTSCPSCAGSSHMSYPKDTHSLNSSKASGVTEDMKMLCNVNTSQAAVEQQSQDVLDCQGDPSSFISKDNDLVLTTSNHIGGADITNVASIAAVEISFCPEVMVQSLNGQTTTTSSFGDQLSHRGDNSSFRAHKDSSEVVLVTLESSDSGSDPSDTSIFRDGQDGAIPEKCPSLEFRKEQAISLVAKMIDSNITHHLVNEEKHDLLKPETVLRDTKPPPDGSSRKSDANESLKPNKSVANAQEPLRQGLIINPGDGSDELVDVRVCDICGDAGREALLALCSTCSDGAEHIYCMRIKMDNVPERGWMCEECIGMQELKGPSQVVAGRAVSPLNPSCLEEFSQSLPKISPGVKQVGETSTKHFGKTFSISGKRRGPQIEMRSAPKKKTFKKNICPLKSLCHGTKTQLTSISSMNNMDKGKSVAPPVSSFNDDRPDKRSFEHAFLSGNRSPKPEKRFCKGPLAKTKTDDMLELNMKVQPSKDDTAKESADGKLEKGSGSGRDLTKKVNVPEKKNNRVYLSSTSSCSTRVRSSRMKGPSETARAVPLLDEKDIQVCGNTKAQTSPSLAQYGKKHANVLARSSGENLSPIHSSDAIICPVKDVNSEPVHKASYPTWKAELYSTATDKNHHLVSSGKVLQHELHSVKPMPTPAPAEVDLSGSSAVPAAECIWKGGFKMVKRGKLPNSCSGIQAHLSTCASSKVHEVISKFGPKLVLNEAPRLETWLTHFRSCYPTEQDIALYFFAEDLQSYGGSYKMLLDGMMEKDLVLEASFDGVQLIVLPSSLLPMASQKWNSLYFLWGVCRVRRLDDRSPHLTSLDVATLNKDFCTPDTFGSPKKCVSKLEAESSSPSQTLHNSTEGPEAVEVLLLLSSALSKFSDHGASSVKCLGAQEKNDVQPDTIQSIHSLKEEPFLCRALPTDDMLKEIQCDDQDTKHISKTDFLPFDKSTRADMVSLAVNSKGRRFYSDRGCRDPNPTSASWSSISIDSGPSGSSDVCAKSYEAHGEQLERPNSRALNLDLCLGSSLEREEQINLDLVLGFPSRYQPNQYTGSGNTRDMNMSLALSL